MKLSPEDVVRELSEKLNARARHVVFVLGAGASTGAGLPDVAGLKERVATSLAGADRDHFTALAATRNLEEVLTHLRLISAVLSGTPDFLTGLSDTAAKALDKLICATIVKILTTSPHDIAHHERFAQWIAHAQYNRPVEIFTTNYDLLVEQGLESVGVPYFDGFIGSYAARFRPDLIEDDWVSDRVRLPVDWARVWKLHGSVSWVVQKSGRGDQIVRMALPPEHAAALPHAIYPSFLKYEESRRLPFVVLADRFRHSLAVPETLVITSGYSFRDEHVNELLFESASLYPRSEVVALFRSTVPELVRTRAAKVPNFTAIGADGAIIGTTTHGFETAAADSPFWKDGRLTLGEFKNLTAFLASRIPVPPSRSLEEPKGAASGE